MIDSLRIREKLVLIVGSLLIPITLLAWLFAEQSFKDIDFARKTLDWEPKVALDEGLRHTIEYFDRLLAAGWKSG